MLIAFLVMVVIYLKPAQQLAQTETAASSTQQSDATSQRSVKIKSVTTPSASGKSTSAYKFAQYNRQPDGYVGTDACKSCHSGRHETYLKTHHSRSLSEVDNSSPAHSFLHPVSSRSYDVLVQDGKTVHRESRYFGNPKQRFQTATLPACYQMGSGAFAKGYLLTDGDMLIQSPVTWYTKANKWDIAPGYHSASHRGMTRVVNDQCLFCHAGLVSQRNDNPYRPVIHELAIGCERCHGPGAEHSELYRQIESGELKKHVGSLDSKIVHPSRLGRREAESLCAQCHMHGDVVVDSPNHDLWDFRPGEDLVSTRIHFKRDKPGEPAGAFTGHFDQMWQSPCYTKSETLTCMTCHPSHLAEEVADHTAWRRDQCNACHQDQRCGLAESKRIKKQNDCITCHMPKVTTEVPHTSTTNHMIGVYESGRPRGKASLEKAMLRPVDPNLPLEKRELDRVTILAQALWSIDTEDLAPNELVLLRDRVAGLSVDGQPSARVQSIVARLDRLAAESMRNDPDNKQAIKELWEHAASAARRTLELERGPRRQREAALEVLANYLMWSGRHPDAIEHWTELTTIRRAAPDWYNLGLCLARAKRLPDAEKALRKSIVIDGTYAPAYRSLSILYQSIDPSRARQMAQMATMLSAP